MPETNFFSRLEAFTQDACTTLKRPFNAHKKRNHYGPYKPGKPTGHVLHYTASPDGGIARMKTLMRRFAINSGRDVGVHFIVFDCLHPELATVRAQYKDLYGARGPLKVDVLHYGLELAFWASNWANRFTVATEMRNLGKLYPGSLGQFYWGRKRNVGNPKYLYQGREPVQIRGMWWEPFTNDQIKAAYQICEHLQIHYAAQFLMSHFLGHVNIHKNKWDPMAHYPFNRLKAAVCNGTPFKLQGYLKELDELSCPRIVDLETAHEFLVAMGYLIEDRCNNEDFSEAVKLLQHKKGLRRSGQISKKTMAAMNRTRRAYKLQGATR